MGTKKRKIFRKVIRDRVPSQSEWLSLSASKKLDIMAGGLQDLEFRLDVALATLQDIKLTRAEEFDTYARTMAKEALDTCKKSSGELFYKFH